MTTVRVTAHVRNLIRAYAEDDESVNDTIIRLLDSSELPRDDDFMDMRKTNIEIDESTLKRLVEFKIQPNESHSDTILRLLNKQ